MRRMISTCRDQTPAIQALRSSVLLLAALALCPLVRASRGSQEGSEADGVPENVRFTRRVTETGDEAASRLVSEAAPCSSKWASAPPSDWTGWMGGEERGFLASLGRIDLEETYYMLGLARARPFERQENAQLVDALVSQANSGHACGALLREALLELGFRAVESGSENGSCAAGACEENERWRLPEGAWRKLGGGGAVVEEDVLCFARDVSTGLGDRFGNMLSVAALAGVQGRAVAVPWRDQTVPGSGHRRQYPWAEIAQRVTLPQNLQVLSGEEGLGHLRECPPHRQIRWEGGELNATQGVDNIPSLAWKAFVPPSGPLSDGAKFAQAFREAGWGFSVEMGDGIPSDFPRDYLALHIRGADKTPDNLEEHFFCTDQVLEQLFACGRTVVALSDDPGMLADFRERFPLLIVPAFQDRTKVEMELRDLAILQRASGIVQHSPEGWSAYSSVMACAKDIPLLNTDELTHDAEGAPNLLVVFRNHGGVPEGIFSCVEKGDDVRFLESQGCDRGESLFY